MPFVPSDIKAVIFDMDGVLLDTEKLYKQAASEAAGALGYTISEELHLSTIGVPADAGERIVRAGLGPAFDFAAFDRRWRAWMEESLSSHVPLKPGAAELLSTLTGRRMPLAVATSTQRRLADRHLQAAGLRQHFDVIVTRDDVSNGKPHPEPFLTAASRLGVDPAHCLAIEDSHNGVRAAHAAGMLTIMVPDLLAPTGEIAALCIAVLDDLEAIRVLFAADEGARSRA